PPAPLPLSLHDALPIWLPGGFIGVDVFLVISGYLITTHLISKPPRSFSEVVDFWGRRIRRLLPASLLVLATTGIATYVFAPESIDRKSTRLNSSHVSVL